MYKKGQILAMSGPVPPTKKPSIVLTKPPVLAALSALDENKNSGKDIKRTRSEIAVATAQNAIPKRTAVLPVLDSGTGGEGSDGTTDAGPRSFCTEGIEVEALGATFI
jgi:hypothetical protein